MPQRKQTAYGVCLLRCRHYFFPFAFGSNATSIT